ncbi:DNA gyrase inhibitor YacG [Paraneptunicella aestuarii]|uniref:DNA gyrase inhibitor YacG n=1 Tax=Paraneptunicella aestuarii TaxID=2831148 RepID=UPI001E5FD3FE|nr:DNA gyrase inhibitor YacG [Paraneptunicella aestuarii]UAA38078.1 DNA gyrase inhibitor YacG [Paraneptunicella aestuarii]
MKVNCPQCQKQIEWDSNNPHRPFCSKRCQLIDLGEWAAETHAIPVKDPQNDIFIDPENIEEMLSQMPDGFFNED